METNLKEMRTEMKTTIEKMASSQDDVKVMLERMEDGQKEIKTQICCQAPGWVPSNPRQKTTLRS
jgi:hypothetical protein